MNTASRTLRQVVGACALGHVALVLIGLSLQGGPLFSDGRQGIVDRYVEGDLTRTFTGGVLEAFGYLLFVAVLAFLGRSLGRSGELARWAAGTGLLCGIVYVAVVFAVGFPAGAAAMYGAQHGLDVDAAFALNNVRLFGYFLSLMVLGVSTLGFAVAALADRTHPRWLGAGGVVTGVVLCASTPLAAIGHQDWGTLVWIVWFVGLAFLLVRRRPTDREKARSAAPRVTLGQS